MPEDTDRSSPIVQAYDRTDTLYKNLVEEVIFALNKMLGEHDIRPASLIGRTKSRESLKEKLQRKHYESIDDIPDLAGVRVVTLFTSDTERVLNVVRDGFHVLEETAPEDFLSTDRMGYAAHHLIVSLKSHSYTGPRYDGLRSLKCEVQVRTAINDAWALVSHNLVYKEEQTMPPVVRRKLNKVAALLEIAQDTFESVREAREAYLRTIRAEQSDPSAFLSLPIDSDTVMSYTTSLFPDLAISETIHALLMRDLDLDRYRTLSDLDHVVRRVLPAVRIYAAEAPGFFRFGTDYLTKSMGLADPDFRDRHPFSKQTRAFFSRVESRLPNEGV